MKLLRNLLGFAGLFGVIGWSAISVIGYLLKGWGDGRVSTRITPAEMFFSLGPIAAYLFYFVTAIRNRSGSLTLAILIQLPLLAVIVWLFTMWPIGPIYALALLIGPALFMAYRTHG